MVAPLIVAAIGLAKQKKDQTEANAKNNINAWLAYEREQQRHEYDVQASIAARRAARAGDAGYMQSAMGKALYAPSFQAPQFVGDNGAGMRIAQGLMAQKEADAAEKAAQGGALGDVDRAIGGWGQKSTITDDDLLGAWGGG